MRLLRLVPSSTHIGFMRRRLVAFAFTGALTVAALISLAVQGLNLGLDFTGGLLIEARAEAPVDLATLRPRIAALGLGATSLQTFGDDNSILIRAQYQTGARDAQTQAIERVRGVLGSAFEVRRTEVIGPQVSHELLVNGLLASFLAVVLIAVYVWFRFEWQFGIAALITTFHDVIATLGLFSLFQLEFNLTVVAAVLTIAGYSVNDTVVVFDRIRENLRRYTQMPLSQLIDLSINQTLSRTVLTGVTTMLAVLALLFFGGPVLFNFSAALAFGILIGTYSSIFVAAALLLHLSPVRALEAPAEQPTKVLGT
ncbi:MAG: protein translocase subunit SecF [Rhodospirillales bacterium]|nr:protein translocase subunit SecF [Rhodospirillales bacterium]